MAEKPPFGNSSGDRGGTLFSRCFWYTIIPLLTLFDAAQVENKVRASHFAHLLFPESVVTNVRGAAAVLQHYHGYYRRAIRDALNRSSRKPFQCGGLRGHDQLVGIDRHLQERRMQRGPDAYLDQLHERVQNALRSAASQADQVRHTRAFLTQVERYLP